MKEIEFNAKQILVRDAFDRIAQHTNALASTRSTQKAKKTGRKDVNTTIILA